MSDLQSEGSAAPTALPALTRPLAIMGGLVVLSAAFTVVVSILLRWSGTGQVSGDFEIVQVATAVSVFAFLPYCQARRGNIMVDTFTNWLPAGFRRGLDALWDLVYAGMAGIIAVQLARGAYDSISSRTVSMVLALPVGWAIALSAGLAGVLALVAAATALQRLRDTA